MFLIKENLFGFLNLNLVFRYDSHKKNTSTCCQFILLNYTFAFFSLYDNLIELLPDQSKEEALPRFLAAAVKHSMGES